MKYAAFAILAFVFVAASIALEPPPQADLIRYMDEVLLRAEYGGAASLGRASRWAQGTVTWTLTGPDARAWRALVVETLQFYDALMEEVVFKEVARGGRLDIWCGSALQWPFRQLLVEPFVYGYSAVLQFGGTIDSAWVFLSPMALRDHSTRVAREELFQAMGFSGDASRPSWSITSSTTWEPELRAVDVWWLAALYSGRIKPGALRDVVWIGMQAFIKDLRAR